VKAEVEEEAEGEDVLRVGEEGALDIAERGEGVAETSDDRGEAVVGVMDAGLMTVSGASVIFDRDTHEIKTQEVEVSKR